MESSKPSVTELFKQSFKFYQFLYHEPNWESCPVSITSRVYKVTDNINLPTSVFADGLSQDYKSLLHEASSNYIKEITSICSSHLRENVPIFPWMEYSAHEVYLALIMTKKRAKKTYKRINHNIIAHMCLIFSELNPDDFWFQYTNNYIINKSEDIKISCNSSPFDSEENNSFSSDPEHCSDHPQVSQDPPKIYEHKNDTSNLDTIKNLDSVRPKVRTPTPKRMESTPKQSKSAAFVSFDSADHSQLPPVFPGSNWQNYDSGFNTFMESPSASNKCDSLKGDSND